MQNNFENPANFDYGKTVDDLLKTRIQAMATLDKSSRELAALGARVEPATILPLPEGMDGSDFERCKRNEFSWEVVYKDGKQLVQYDEYAMQNDYGNIDHENVELVRWISNFNVETSNTCKRVIVTLDMRTGLFSFFNGITHPGVQEAYFKPIDSMEGAKLILKKRARVSKTSGANGVEESLFYNRFLLGFELGDTKRLVCIEPNGFIHLQD